MVKGFSQEKPFTVDISSRKRRLWISNLHKYLKKRQPVTCLTLMMFFSRLICEPFSFGGSQRATSSNCTAQRSFQYGIPHLRMSKKSSDYFQANSFNDLQCSYEFFSANYKQNVEVDYPPHILTPRSFIAEIHNTQILLPVCLHNDEATIFTLLNQFFFILSLFNQASQLRTKS